MKMMKHSSNSLTKLVINDNYGIQYIPLYLHSLRHLELPEILLTELISIFKTCVKLIYLSVVLDNDENLIGLGKFVPKTLEWIQLKKLEKKINFMGILRRLCE